MKKFFNHSLLIAAGVATMALASACGGGSGDDDDDSTGGTSGTGGTGGSGSGALIPGPDGWIAGEDNDIGVQGSWYPYGDQYGEDDRGRPSRQPETRLARRAGGTAG